MKTKSKTVILYIIVISAIIALNVFFDYQADKAFEEYRTHIEEKK